MAKKKFLSGEEVMTSRLQHSKKLMNDIPVRIQGTMISMKRIFPEPNV